MPIPEINDSTKIYRYFSTEKLISFIETRRLYACDIKLWPDSMEGKYHEFAHQGKKINKNEFFGICFSLHDNIESNDERQEIIEFGDASMWKSYCNNGGARIMTTIGELKKAFSPHDIYIDGPVEYRSMRSTGPMPKDKRRHLLHKRFPFRHENEYRIIFNSNGNVVSDIIELQSFVKEALVAPETQDKKWASIATYQYLVRQSFCIRDYSINPDNICRISQLYAPIGIQ